MPVIRSSIFTIPPISSSSSGRMRAAAFTSGTGTLLRDGREANEAASHYQLRARFGMADDQPGGGSSGFGGSSRDQSPPARGAPPGGTTPGRLQNVPLATVSKLALPFLDPCGTVFNVFVGGTPRLLRMSGRQCLCEATVAPRN